MRLIKYIYLFLTIIFLVVLFSCSSQKMVTAEDASIGESIRINLIDGETREGAFIKKEGTSIKYVDAKSHKTEELATKKIRNLEYANKIYDLEGNQISEQEISSETGITKTIAYGFGGFIMGAAVGFGAALPFEGEVKFIYPMAGIGLAGGIYFGIMGSDSDREDAIIDIQKERYKVSQAKVRAKLLEEKKKLEEQRKQKEKLQDKVKTKKKD